MKKTVTILIILAVLLIAGCTDLGAKDCGEMIFTEAELTDEQSAGMTEKLTCYNTALKGCNPATLKMTILGATLNHEIIGLKDGTCNFRMYDETTEFPCSATLTELNAELSKGEPDLVRFCTGLGGLDDDGSDDGSNDISGDGGSFETAVVVDSVSEEYRYIEIFACLDNEGIADVPIQKLIENEGKMYDVLTVLCVDGEEKDFYFNIDNFFGIYD